MKKQLFVLWTLLFAGIVLLQAQEVPDGVVTAFQKSNPQSLERYMHQDVSLLLAGEKNEVMSRTQVVAAIRAFFAANKVKGFDVNHKGKRDESAFLVGTLRTSTGSYRVNCFLKKTGNNYLIHYIRIENNQ